MTQVQGLENNLRANKERAKKFEKTEQRIDHRREIFEIALAIKRSSRDMAEKKHNNPISREQLNLDYIKKLETDVEGLKEKVKQLEDDCVAAQVDSFDVGYNNYVLVASASKSCIRAIPFYLVGFIIVVFV